MDVAEVSIPEVRAMHQNARFFRDKDIDFIEISFVGSKDTLVKKVAPTHMAKFAEEWAAYCDGRPPEKRKGTPLTDVPGVDQLRADQFIQANVHTAEELVALSDGQCQALGHGTITARREGQALLAARTAKFTQAQLDRIGAESKKLGTAPAEASPDITAMKADINGLKSGVATLNDGVSAILAALSELKQRKPGRPKKESA